MERNDFGMKPWEIPHMFGIFVDVSVYTCSCVGDMYGDTGAHSCMCVPDTTSSVIPQVASTLLETRSLPGMELVIVSSLVCESKDLQISASLASSSHHDKYIQCGF